jgi:hypothetical protein
MGSLMDFTPGLNMLKSLKYAHYKEYKLSF